MISLVKDILNPINWFKLISEPGKIKIVFEAETPYVPILIPYYKHKNGDLDLDA